MTAYHGLRGKTVLIVEDHPDYREMLALTLRTAGSRVVTASNVSEARREVVAYRPDAVISDLRLMDGTGFDFVSWLRSTERERVGRIPCIAVSGHPEMLALATAHGFSAAMIKPVDFGVLANRLAALTASDGGEAIEP
jgi:DNA-binding response OmpR family regulator